MIMKKEMVANPNTISSTVYKNAAAASTSISISALWVLVFYLTLTMTATGVSAAVPLRSNDHHRQSQSTIVNFNSAKIEAEAAEVEITTTSTTTSTTASTTAQAQNHRQQKSPSVLATSPLSLLSFSLKSIVNLNDLPRGGGTMRRKGKTAKAKMGRGGGEANHVNSTGRNSMANSRSNNSIVEPVAFVALKDVENLQNEVFRLRKILEDHNIVVEDDDDGVNNGDCSNNGNGDKNHNNSCSKSMVAVGEAKSASATHDRNNNICSYICNVLNERQIQVMNKQRAKNFARRYRKDIDSLDGKYSIVSGHGRGEVQSRDGHKKQTQKPTQQTLSELVVLSSLSSPSSYFPSNLLSLDMVFTQEQYNLACVEIQTKHINEIADDQEMYQKELLFKPKLMLRAAQLLINFMPVTVTLGAAFWSPDFRENVWYNILSRCLAKSGPAFIKWGQWASTRTDMFPDKLCQSLSELHADAPSHNWKITQKTVEEALCIPKGTLFEVFEEFDRNPVASGSIAQVHRAVLRRPSGSSKKERKMIENQSKRIVGDTSGGKEVKGGDQGTMVAVKVRHPNVSRLIDMDFRLMSIVANVADRIPALSWLRIRESVEQFSHTMAAQAHLNVEAHHLEVLNYNFRNWDTVNFPSPLFACSSVIIESFEKGKICTTVIDKYDQLAESKGSRNRQNPIVDEVIEVSDGEPLSNDAHGGGHEVMPVSLAKFIVTTGLSLYLKMLLVDNLMHADLHPGNIMLQFQILGEQYGDTSPLSSLGDVPVGGASPNCETVARQQQMRGNPTRRTSNIVSKASTDFYGQVTLVDAGMVAQLDEDESTNFIGLISALGEGDGRAAGEAILRFNNNYHHSGKTDPESDIDDDDNGTLSEEEREAFIQDIIILFREKCRGYGTNVDFGDVLRGVLGIVKKHRIQLSANYATLVVNALCIESLAKRVCPSYNVLDASKPLLKAYHVLPYDNGLSHERFLSNRPELRKSLVKALTPILYIKKKLADDRFFREIESKRQEGIITPIRRRRRQNPLQQLCSPLVKIFINIYRSHMYQKVIAVGVVALLLHHTVLSLTFNESENIKKMKQDQGKKESSISRIIEERTMDE